MPGLLYRRLAPRRRPGPGAVVDRAHPLAAGLVGLYLFEEGGGAPRNLARPQNRGTLSGAKWGPTRRGRGVIFAGGASDYLTLGTEDSLAFPTSAATLVYGYQKLVSSPIASIALGVDTSGTFEYAGIHLPWSDGTVYFDWGGQNEDATRESVAGLTVADNVWVFSTGARGMEIWQDGLRRSANAATPTRNLIGSLNIKLGGVAARGIAADAAQVWYFAIYARQLSAAAIQWVSAEPYAMVRPAAPTPRFWLLAVGGPTVQSRTSAMAVAATFTPAQLSVRLRTVTAPAGGTFTPARLALRARTLAATAGGTLVGTDLALRARTLAATAGGTLTATGSGITAGIQARTAALAITAQVTTGQLAVRARTLTAPAGGLLTAIGGVPGAVSARTLTVLLQAALTVTGVGRLALRGIAQRRAGTPGPDSHRGGTSSGGKRWTL